MILTFEVECLIIDGGGDHLPELLSHCIHHVPGGQLGLSQHSIPATFNLQLIHNVHTICASANCT